MYRREHRASGWGVTGCWFFGAVAALLVSCASAYATTYTWTGGGGALNQLWSNPQNWLNGTVPAAGVDTDIVFGNNNALTFNPMQDNGSQFSLRSLSFNTTGYTLSINSLIFNTPGFIHLNTPFSSITTPHPTTSIELSSDLTIDGNGDAAINALIRGGTATRIIKTGTGAVSLTQQRQFNGEVQINGGQLVMTDALGIQGSTVVINVDNGFNLNGLAVTAVGGLSGSGSLDIGSALFIIRPTGRPEAAPHTGRISGTGKINIANDINVTLGGAGSTAHRLEVNGHLKLDGGLSFGGASMLVTSSQPIDQFEDNALMVGNPRAPDGTVGTLTVRDGFLLNTIGNAGGGKTWVGGTLSTPSTITITGSGSRWRAGNINYIGGYLGAGEVTVEAEGAITDAIDFTIGAGSRGAGTLLVQSGGTVNVVNGLVGAAAGSNGLASVTGPGSTWTINSLLNLGTSQSPAGTGTLLVSDGGAVVNRGATNLLGASSSITVNGGTFRTAFLNGQVGTINLTDPAGGAALTIDGAAGLATYSSAIRGTGSIVKNGGSTQILNGENAWQGRTIVNGGTLLLPTANSTSYTTDNDGRLILQFGNFGFSSLAANSGGTIEYQSSLIIGGFFHGRGSHDFRHVSSFNGSTFSPDLVLALNSTTLNNVTNSGALSVGGVTWVGGYNTSAGSITLAGDVNVTAFENSGVIVIPRRTALISSGANLVSGGGGRITIDPQGNITLLGSTSLDLNGSLLVNDGSVKGTVNVHFNGLATGSGEFGEVKLFENGRFAPGASANPAVFGPAAVPVAEHASFAPGSSLAIEIGGRSAGAEFDQVNVGGAVELAGTLEIVTTNKFVPAALDSFKIVSFGSRKGHFSIYLGTDAGKGLAYAPIYGREDLSLIATIPGDASLDAKVDFADLVAVAQNYGSRVSDVTDSWWLRGDFTYDGLVDFKDLVILAQHYSQSAVGASSEFSAQFTAEWAAALDVASVPEPSLAGLLVLPLMWRRRRK